LKAGAAGAAGAVYLGPTLHPLNSAIAISVTAAATCEPRASSTPEDDRSSCTRARSRVEDERKLSLAARSKTTGSRAPENADSQTPGGVATGTTSTRRNPNGWQHRLEENWTGGALASGILGCFAAIGPVYGQLRCQAAGLLKLTAGCHLTIHAWPRGCIVLPHAGLTPDISRVFTPRDTRPPLTIL